MLVLSRKTNEEILIGNDVRITIVSMQGGKVRLGIDAPRDTNVVRTELLKRDEREHGFRKPVSDFVATGVIHGSAIGAMEKG